MKTILPLSFLFLSLFACNCSKSSKPKQIPRNTQERASRAAAVDPWRRVPAPEPHPEARGLYRYLLEAQVEGRSLHKILEQIKEKHPESRFALRLRTEGSSSATLFASLGVAAAILARSGLNLKLGESLRNGGDARLSEKDAGFDERVP